MTNILPIYKGYIVDERTREFRRYIFGKLPKFFSFDSPKGRKWLGEMNERGSSTASVPVDSPQGQKRLKQLKKIL